MSLLEVLIAVFVLTFGLMGIAMIIPAGRFLMVEASKSDRGTAAGRATLEDMKLRGWLDPSQWNERRPGNIVSPIKRGVSSAGQDVFGLVYGETFLIDPIFFQTAGSLVAQHFPYSEEFVREYPRSRRWPERALARRVTPKIPVAMAERITTWADDLIFTLEDDGQRPRGLYRWSDGVGDVFPRPPAGSAHPDRLENEGKFTWAAMVTPIMPNSPDASWDHDGDISTPAFPIIASQSISRYEVSIVVFYQRDFYCPVNAAELADSAFAKERSVFAEITGYGIGGGDVLLFIKGDGTGTISLPDNPPNGYLNVRKNDWLMLKALDRSRRVSDGTPGAYTPTVCKWYRVLGVSDIHPAEIEDPSNLGNQLQGRGRYVTLAGPDWEVNTTDGPPGPAFDPATDIAEAAIIENVVGVYTTVVDLNSL